MDIRQIRAQKPEWGDLDDMQVVNVLKQVYYPDLAEGDIAKAIGVSQPAPPPAARTLGGTLKDVGISALKGAIGVPEAVVGLADIPTGGYAGKVAEAVGFRPKEARQILDDQLSDAQKQANARVQGADGFTGKFVAALQNPSVIGHSAVESLPLMAAGGVVGRGVAALAPRVGAVGAAAAGEGIVGGGSAAEQIRQETPDGTLSAGQVGASLASGAGTAAFGLLGGKVARSLGIHDVDTMIVQAGHSPAASKGIVRRVLEGAMSEGILEELPQSIHEQVMQNLALGKPLEEGVDQAAVLGMLTGGAMGGGAQFLGGGHRPAANDPSDTAVPAANDPAAPLALPAPTITVGPDGMAATADQRQMARDELLAREGQIVERGPLSRAARTALGDGAVQDVQPKTGPLAAAAAVMPAQEATSEGPINQGAAATQDGALASEGGAVVQPDGAAPAAPADAGGLAQGVLGREAPAVAAADAAQQPVAAPFPTYEEAEAFRREQKARGGGVQALPAPAAEGGFRLVGKDSPDYPAAEALRTERRQAKARADAGVLEGDITNKQGMPFTIALPARNAAKKAGPGHEVVQVKGGYVVRKVAPSTEAAPSAPAEAPAAEAPALAPQEAPSLAGAPRPDGWTEFAKDSGTLSVPRSEMPQIKAEHRGAMVNFMNARGIAHQEEEVPAGSLKPTQAEFSQEKVEKAKAADEGGSRAILVSRDGHVLDGHHQWLAAREAGGPVRIIRLDAPIKQLLDAAHEFPSSTTDTASSTTPEPTPAANPPPAESQIVEHVTAKGKTLRGVVRQDLDAAAAKAIDPYTFQKDGGWFIREKYLGQAAAPAGSATIPEKISEPAAQREQPAAAPNSEKIGDGKPEPASNQGDEFITPTSQSAVRQAIPIVTQFVKGEIDKASMLDRLRGLNLLEAQVASVTYRLGDDITAAEIRSAARPEKAPIEVKANTVFTEDAAAAARALLKRKLGQLNSGIDPEILQAGITLAGYHIEKGARTFAAYAKAMLDDMGEGIAPYLKSFYLAVRFDPRAAAFEGMDSAAAVEAAELPRVEAAPAGADTRGKDDGRNAARELDRASPGALARAPAEDVRSAAEGREAGAGSERGGRGDGEGPARADGAGRDLGRGVGAGPGAVPVPARGAAADAPNAKERRVPRAPRPDEGAVGLRPQRQGLTPEAGANPAPNAPVIRALQATDFTIGVDLALGEGGQKTKFKNNVAAIRLAKEFEADPDRWATPEEQRTLARYVGWGGLAQAFDAANGDWAREHAELKQLLTPEEYDDAARSTRYAHYTSREIIEGGIYAALRRFGFTGGKLLEAGAGVGNFLGLMPADLRSSSRFTAIERDRLSSTIARQLYPQQNVQRADFTEFKGSDGYFDAAVGNPPFASDPQVDASGRKHLSGLSLHNYFFAKAVDMLREGGVLAQVVTNAFLDANADTARRYIADRTVFLGAIRLPNNAFAKNAGTEVTTDLIFLQKRADGDIGSRAAKQDARRWLAVGTHTDSQGRKVALNQYFIDNPDMMLGDFGAYGTMYRGDMPALVARDGQDTAALLREAVGRLPEGVFKSIADTATAGQHQAAIVALRNPQVQEGGYYVAEGGQLMQRLPDLGGEARAQAVTPATPWTEKTTLGESGFARIKALSEMRGTLRGLIAAEMADDDKGMGQLRSKLNEQYDAYRKEHGLINDPSTLRVFEDDPDYPLLASLEHGYTPGIGPAAAKRQGIKPTKSTAKKAPIFDRRVVAARKPVRKVDSPADALAVSMAERGKLDADYIGKLLGREPEEVLRELSTGDKPALFRDPATDEYVLRDAYLSGNVRAKLAQARAAGASANIRALEEVQPEDVGAGQIVARVGSPWVPTKVYEDFAGHLFGEGTAATVRYVPLNSSFQISVKPGNEVAFTTTYGTSAVDGEAMLAALLNNRPIKVTYKDSEGRTHVNAEATEQANNKAQEIKDKFSDWLFSDAERSEQLVRAYNDTNNNYVTRVYDGSLMDFPGKVPDDIIKFRRHQRNAIARTVQDRTALYDHVVGAGKTFTVVASAMELKRTGLAKKPMVAVPNHLVKQWAADFYRLYPGANILTATKKDFERANRRKFLAKIATGDWDAVVIAHSSFGFIRPAPEFEAEFNRREIAKIVKTIDQVEVGGGDKAQKKRTVKQLEGLKERLENRIKALRDKPMDDLLDFEQIGVDQLFVDEFHLFKNLMFSTKMQNVQGLGDSQGSQRAYDMLVKINQIFAKNGRDQGFVAATGTPVSNSLAEMYHMMRYLMPTQMRELGFESFDAWANTFASVDQVWMQKPSGDGFKASARMANFVNTPELLKMFDQVCDTVTMDDIKAAYAEENDGAEFPLPKLKGDRRTPVSLDKTPAQEAYMRDLAERARVLEARKGPPKKGEDNVLVIMGDGRKAAMDIRLVDVNATEREAGSRVDRASDEISARYRRFAGVKGTQLVFSDLGTPVKHAKAELKEYEALQARVAAASEDVQASATLGNEAAQAIVEDAEAAQAELEAKGPDWLDAVRAAERGFSVYDDLRAALVEKGIPAEEIAFIHDYNTDEQKAALFRKVNAGDIRVVLGSTPKMGAGTNVQERLVALHHLDVPWKPSDVEQREGRIIRQGNVLAHGPMALPGFEVEILAYVTKDTLDMRMWQVQETKLKMINQLRTRKVGREVDNAFEDLELSAGEMQAAATGNIDLLHEIQLRTEVKKLEQRKRAFEASRNELASRRRRAAEVLGNLPREIEAAAPLVRQVQDYQQAAEARLDDFKATIDGREFTSWRQAQEYLREVDDRKVVTKDKDGKDVERAAPIDVTMNGERFTARAALADAFSELRGDLEPIVWKVGDTEYRRRAKIQTAIRQPVVDAIADQTEKSLGTIAGFEVRAEGQVTARGNELEVVLLDGDKVIASRSGEVMDSMQGPTQVVRWVDGMLNGIVSEQRYLQQRLQRAQKEQADLEKTEDVGSWPDTAKLDEARARHKEVLGRLSGKGTKAEGASGDTPAFSRGEGAGLGVERARQAVDALTRGWANAPEVVVLESMADPAVPGPVRTENEGQQARGAMGEPEGFFYGGKAYLLAGQMNTPDDVARVLFHEVLGHHGLRGTFGDELGAVLAQLVGARRGQVFLKAVQYGLDPTKPAHRLIAAEEVLAEMAQSAPELGFVKRALAAIRTWLREHVPALRRLRLTDEEIVRDFILPARRFVERGGPGGPGGGVPVFSRGGASAAPAPQGLNDTRDFREKAQNAVNDLFRSPGVVSWWHKSVGTMHDLAERSPVFKRVYDSVQRFLQDVSYYATEAADLAPRILPKLDTLADLKKTALSAEDTKALSRPVFEGTLLWGRDAEGKLVKVADGGAEEAGTVFTDAELKEHFGLTPEQIGLYREFRAATDKSLQRLGQAEMLRFGGKDTEALRDLVMDAPTAGDAAKLLREHLELAAKEQPERADVLLDTADRIDEKAQRISDLVRRGYAPLSRFGSYTLDVVDANGDRVYFGMFESRLERGAMARRMRENFPDATVTMGTNSEQAYKLFNGITPETLELFGEMVGLEAEGDAAQHQMFQQYLKLAKSNRSAMKRLIERKGIAGFSEDAGRVLAGFVYSNARLTSQNLHQGEITRATSEIPKDEGQLKDIAVKLTDYVRNPQEEAQALRGLLFTQYLGGSLASAMVNMTQPLAVTMPYLSQWGGVRAAAGQMRSALRDVLRKSTGDARLDAALKRAEAEGIVAPQEVHQLLAQARGQAALKSGDGTFAGNARALASNSLSKLGVAWGKPFSLAEQFNRRVTFIAAYRTAVQAGMADPAGFAEKAIRDTQFVYNKGNKPQWARGAVGGIVFTFKQYSISYVELLHRLATQGGPEGKRAAAFMLAMLFLMSGAGGLPFMEDAEDLVDGMAQRLGYAFSTKQARRQFLIDVLGQGAGQFVERGVSGVPGVPIDIAGRLGMGNLLPGTGLLTQKRDHTSDVAELLGPSADLAKRAFQGSEKLLSGNPYEAGQLFAPRAAENLRKGMEMAIDGQYRDSRGRKVIDTDFSEAVSKMIGFQPADVARVQEASAATQGMVEQNRIAKQNFADDMAKAVYERDYDRQQKVREAVREWNQRNPHSPISLDMAAVRRRVVAMRADKAKRIEQAAPKAIRAEVRKQLAENS
ncbi:PLxRFG domain-containing protein [Pseudacidovorax intermedius]|uniref:PLxRFG domain-containing protein n=1 Tax=Pseudacidovorax intermedius TaxID=433924 RepID=UPI00034C3082|nr:PLxRFG domain-containing protein [Pseudacidovorax intermedius]